MIADGGDSPMAAPTTRTGERSPVYSSRPSLAIKHRPRSAGPHQTHVRPTARLANSRESSDPQRERLIVPQQRARLRRPRSWIYIHVTITKMDTMSMRTNNEHGCNKLRSARSANQRGIPEPSKSHRKQNGDKQNAQQNSITALSVGRSGVPWSRVWPGWAYNYYLHRRITSLAPLLRVDWVTRGPPVPARARAASGTAGRRVRTKRAPTPAGAPLPHRHSCLRRQRGAPPGEWQTPPDAPGHPRTPPDARPRATATGPALPAEPCTPPHHTELAARGATILVLN